MNQPREVAARRILEVRGLLAAAETPEFDLGQVQSTFYQRLHQYIVRDIAEIENRWRHGIFSLSRINCASESSKGVYCLQYDADKIVSGLRDNTIKVSFAGSFFNAADLETRRSVLRDDAHGPHRLGALSSIR